MKILLIGGTGTLSTAVLERCLELGYDVTIMNRGNNNRGVPDSVEIIRGDFYDVKSIERIANLKNHFDVICDFLSRRPEDIERVYPILCFNCFQYIFVSTACVYRRGESDFPIKEDSPKPNPNWSYNVEKYNCECKLIELHKSIFDSKGGGTHFYTIVRPYITYDSQRIPYGIAPAYKYHRTLIERIRHGKPMFVWNDGTVRVTLKSTKDFAIGFVGLFMNEKAHNTDFHITSDFSYTWKDVLELLYKKMGVESNIVSCTVDEIFTIWPEFRGMLIGDRILEAIFDNGKIKDAVPELVFKTDLNLGIEKVISYYNNRENYDYDYVFDAKADRLLSGKVKSCRYIKYKEASLKSKILYFVYRNFNNRHANWIVKFLHISK